MRMKRFVCTRAVPLLLLLLLAWEGTGRGASAPWRRSNRSRLAAILKYPPGPARLEALHSYVEEYPDDPYGHAERGLAWIEVQSLPSALRDEETKETGLSAGDRERRRQERVRRARRAFERFVEQAPKEKEYGCYLLSVADLYLHDFDKVVERITAYESAGGDAPLPRGLLQLLGIALRESGALEKADARLSALEGEDQPWKRHNLALLELRRDRLEEALSHLREGLRRVDSDVYRDLLAGVLAEQAGRDAEARDYYARVVAGGAHAASYHFAVLEAARRITKLTPKNAPGAEE